MSERQRDKRFNFVAHFLLIPVAVLTLVPFFYLVASSLKEKDVFFTGQFLPRVGLFAVETTTGEISLSDPTHLDGVESADFPIEVTRGDGTVLDVLIRYNPSEAEPANAADFDEVISVPPLATFDDPELESIPGLNQAIGSARLPGAPNTTYEITDGNPGGIFGVAWGLLSLGNFGRLFGGDINFGRAVLNSFFLASVTSVFSTLGAAMGGYALAKHHFRGKAFFLALVLAALVIPGALLLAPAYQLLYWLGLLDSYAGLIIPAAAPAFGVFLFRQAMINGVPNEMLESSRIDGCGEIRMFFEMVLPLVRPMVGAYLLITFLGTWNNFIGPQIVLQSPEKFPLSVAINQLRGIYGIDYGLIMAGTLVAILPVLVLFLMLQKEFIAGLTAGAVKG
ncbi:MAG: carbohydrate ABC transporter permease [Planctomycetota bacterium]